jgi:hypothetical protein
MATILISIVTVALMSVVASRANVRFRAAPRLPMDWGWRGKVNWTAPRRVALALIPALAALVLGIHSVLSLTFAPRPGQAHLALPILVLTSLTLLEIQALYLCMVARTLR